MNSTAIIYPVSAMFFLTLSIVVFMAIQRIQAVKNKEVNGEYYVLYSKGEESPRLQLLTRHVKNLFEVPPLFYIVVLFLFVTDNVTLTTVALAWGYFLSRLAHSIIHLSSNNVIRRFLAFLISLIILAGLWIVLFVSIVN